MTIEKSAALPKAHCGGILRSATCDLWRKYGKVDLKHAYDKGSNTMSDELRLDWAGEMGFTAQTASGHTLQLDATVDNGGQNAGPQPLELLLVALAGCSA